MLFRSDEEQQGKYGREEYEISRHFFEKIGARLSLQVREAEICDFALEEQPDFVSKLNYLNLHAAESGMRLYLIIDEYV